MFHNRDAPYDPVENPPVFKFQETVTSTSDGESTTKSIASESAENCDVAEASCDEPSTPSESSHLNSGSEISIPFDSFRFASLIVAVRSGHLITAFVIPNDPEFTTEDSIPPMKRKEDTPIEKVTIETTVKLLNESDTIFPEIEIEDITFHHTDHHVNSPNPSSTSSTKDSAPLSIQKSVTVNVDDMSPRDYRFTMLLRSPLSSWIRWQRLPSGEWRLLSSLTQFDFF